MSFARLTPHASSPRSVASSNVSQATRQDAMPTNLPHPGLTAVQEHARLSTEIKRLDKGIRKLRNVTNDPEYSDLVHRMKSERAEKARARNALAEKVAAVRIEIADGKGGAGALNEMRMAMRTINDRISQIQDELREIKELLR